MDPASDPEPTPEDPPREDAGPQRVWGAGGRRRKGRATKGRATKGRATKGRARTAGGGDAEADSDPEEQTRTERLAQLGSLLAGFAHEVRNPLSTIGLNLELVREDLDESDEPKDRRTRRRLEVVGQEVQRLQTILEEFLTFAREPRFHLRPTDMNALLRSVVELCEAEFTARRIALQFFPDERLGAVDVDPDMIRSAVINLIRNARDACSEGDEVLVGVRYEPDSPAFAIQIVDTGPGMPEEVREKALRPYFTTKKEGTGLGLPLARRIVLGHRGAFRLASEPDKGTQFTLILPCRSLPPALPADTESDTSEPDAPEYGGPGDALPPGPPAPEEPET